MPRDGSMTLIPELQVALFLLGPEAKRAPRELAAILRKEYPGIDRDYGNFGAAIRAALQRYSTDASPKNYVGPDLFAKDKNHRWSLRDTSARAQDRAVLSDPAIQKTDRIQIILARRGQGRFRSEVLERWGNQCAVTGCSHQEAIRASHIVPWATCTNKERLDPDNGLPLIANLDALFDAWFISFEPDGKMLVSKRLSGQPGSLFCQKKPLVKKPSRAMERYLARHRARFEEFERLRTPRTRGTGGRTADKYLAGTTADHQGEGRLS